MNALGIALLEFQEFANLYEKQHSEFGRDPRLLIDLGVTGLPKAKAISRRLVADGQQLEAAAGRLAVEEAVGGTQDEWRDFTAPEGSGLVSYIGIADGFDGDLIAAARASSGSKSQTI
jgi:hypothetical protein